MINITKQAVPAEYFYTSDFSGKEIDLNEEGLLTLTLKVVHSPISNMKSLPFNLTFTSEELLSLLEILKPRVTDAFKNNWNDQLDTIIKSGTDFLKENGIEDEEQKNTILKSLDYFEKVKF